MCTGQVAWGLILIDLPESHSCGGQDRYLLSIKPFPLDRHYAKDFAYNLNLVAQRVSSSTFNTKVYLRLS